MNKNKKGKPSFVFPNSFLLVIGYMRYSFFHLPYRQTETEEIIDATRKSLPADPPSYGHICKRINKLNVNINNHDIKNEDDDKYIIIATADSTGIKISNSGGPVDG